jgi:hypothetical protein
MTLSVSDVDGLMMEKIMTVKSAARPALSKAPEHTHKPVTMLNSVRRIYAVEVTTKRKDARYMTGRMASPYIKN